MQATSIRTMHPAKFLLPLFVLMATLCGLTAARPAQAQGVYLPDYGTDLILHYPDRSTKKIHLSVKTQDSAGHFTGTLNVNNALYSVTGTRSYFGISSGVPSYTLVFDATFQSRSFVGLVISSTIMHFSGWIGEAYPLWFTGSFSWQSSSIFTGVTSGYGIFDGNGYRMLLPL